MSKPRQPASAERAPSVPDLGAKVAELQTEQVDAETALATVAAFRDPWNRFVTAVRAIVQASDTQPWPIEDRQWRPKVLLADMDRLALKTRLAALPFRFALPDPLGQILRTSFIQPADGLYHVFGRRSGPTIESAVSSDRFEWAVQEAGGELDEMAARMQAARERAQREAEALQRQLDAARHHELEVLERKNWSFRGLWSRLTRSWVGKVTTWLLITLLGGIVVAYGVPAVVRLVADVVRLVRGRPS